MKEEIPSLHSIAFLAKDNKDIAWQVIPEDAVDFEEAVKKVCEMIVNGDLRIGRIPKLEKRKNNLND